MMVGVAMKINDLVFVQNKDYEPSEKADLSFNNEYRVVVYRLKIWKLVSFSRCFEVWLYFGEKRLTSILNLTKPELEEFIEKVQQLPKLETSLEEK